jgi:mannose-6-phosphate isomerase-like protein (cupin superfamily)
MQPSRRTLLEALPLIATSLAVGGPSAFGAAPDANLISSFATPFDQLPVHANGPNVARPILDGISHSGTHLEAHETSLAPGSMPHPPHHHVHEELFLISKGTLEVTIAGKSTTIGPGSAAFVHSGEEHGVRNVGPETAQYFVIAIGSDS